ncbi:DEAD/DEAH-box helicase [Penicillium macrosclerotiorum]|uniref:DEAD/DEAH-box helicase n=1 Tax=Penicillium macrosclerotiorum TaxID=303699 RepID=UPI00254782FD|nr:DEAD/DEAH-box helicase [Penicillium macrosclerotiorum]KAJ5666896.1 DEAD/DEAH-box helicase [Penicillium macrosclerotiorum]
MSKAGAEVVLRCLLGWDVDVDALPWGEVTDGGEVGVGAVGELAGGLETVVVAKDVPWKAGCGPGEREAGTQAV